MSYIRTRCPNRCKYKSGDTCVASECPYQTGNVRYDIRLNTEDKPTKINEQAKQAVKEFAEKLKTRFEEKEQHYICMYDWNGHSAVVDCTNEVDELLKEYE